MGCLFGMAYYLFITYIVTSKPKRISVAAGVVHMIISFKVWRITMIRFMSSLWATIQKQPYALHSISTSDFT